MKVKYKVTVRLSIISIAGLVLTAAGICTGNLVMTIGGVGIYAADCLDKISEKIEEIT